MADVPEGVVLERNRDPAGRGYQLYVRRGLLCLIAVLPVLALLGVFGQTPSTTTAQAPAASLSVTAPTRLRSGLIFQVRVEVDARRDLHELQIVFDRGWWESMSVNSIVPEPTSEASRDGKVVLSYGALPAGRKLAAWIYFQVNPTNVGERRENVAIEDGSTPLAELHRSLTIFP
jgi:hypothetical protein